jgi:hypothetical protein
LSNRKDLDRILMIKKGKIPRNKVPVGERLTVIGSCHPIGKDKGYDGLLLKKSEIDALSNALSGIPVLDEHNPNKVVGEVVKAFKNKGTNELMVELQIYRNTANGVNAVERLRNGNLKGLSLGINHLIKKGPDFMKVMGRQITEVSVTESPDLDTFITFVEEDTQSRKHASQIIDIRIENDKLKKELYKSDTHLQTLIGKYVNPKRSGEILNGIKKQRTKTEKMSEENNAKPAEEKQDRVNFEDELRKLKEENEKLKIQVQANSELLGGNDVTKVKRLVEEEQQREQKMIEDWNKKRPAVIENVKRMYAEHGVPPDDSIIGALSASDDLFHDVFPLYELASMASSYSERKVSTMEAEYQKRLKAIEDESAKNKELLAKFQESAKREEPRKVFRASDFAQNRQGYPVEEKKRKAEELYEPMDTRGSYVPQVPNMNGICVSGLPITISNPDVSKNSFLEMLKKKRGNSARIEKIDYTGITGFDFGGAVQGVNDDGSIASSVIRSDRTKKPITIDQ